MSEIWIIILILAGVGAIVFFGFWRRKKTIEKAQVNTLSRLPIDWPPSFAYKVDEPNTPFIQSNVPIPDNVIEVCTRALGYMIRATNERFGWSGKATVFEYNIAFLEPTATNQDGSPALMVHIKNAEGKILQSIQSAGTCIGVGSDGIIPTNICLPHQAATNWRYLNYLLHSVYNEGEHDRENHCDKSVFNSYLGANDIHPHTPPQFPMEMPDAPSKAGFLNREQAAVCRLPKPGGETVITGRK
jgi:hypothetical protein